MKCTNCGAENTENSIFCQECGIKLNERVIIQEPKNENNKPLIIMIGVFGVILFIIMAAIIAVLVGKTSNSENTQATPVPTLVSASATPTVTTEAYDPGNPNKGDYVEPPKVDVVVPEDTTTKYTMYVVNCDEWISLRTAPDTNASRITTIPLGNSCGFIERAANGFYKIAYNGKIGYALAQYLSTEKPDVSVKTEFSSKVMYVANCDEWITLRKSDSTSASEITKIPLGASVEYLGQAGNGFYKVRYNGSVGYALSQYLSDTKRSKSAPETRKMRVVNCQEWITLRSSDSTSASEITKIPLGATVEYLGQAGNGFYKVRYNGSVGYALSQYLG